MLALCRDFRESCNEIQRRRNRSISMRIQRFARKRRLRMPLAQHAKSAGAVPFPFCELRSLALVSCCTGLAIQTACKWALVPHKNHSISASIVEALISKSPSPKRQCIPCKLPWEHACEGKRRWISILHMKRTISCTKLAISHKRLR